MTLVAARMRVVMSVSAVMSMAVLSLALVAGPLFGQTRPPSPPPKTTPTTPTPPPKTTTVQPPVRRPTTPARVATVVQSTAPNIIVLVVDDWGWQDLSVPLYRDSTAANRRYQTPAIAKLASEGVTFTDAYASAPVGSPSRVALLTGRSAALSRVTDDSLSRDRDVARSYPAIKGPTWHHQGLSAIAGERVFTGPLLPRLLRAAGYRTAHIGRPGWSGDRVVGGDASAVGFDESVPAVRRSDSLAAEAMRVIGAARTARKPFFVMVSYDAIRLQPRGDERFISAALARGLDLRDARYTSAIQGVDESVRDLMGYLDANQLTANTIVVLLSDNGGLATVARSGLRDAQNAPLKSGMGSAYEGGLRVPMIVRWPGVARKGFRSLTPVVTDDVFPTLLRAARVPNAAQHTRGIVGRDLTSTLDNSAPVAYDRPLLWHYPHYWGIAGPGVEPFSAVRAGRWKLIYFYSGSRYELYDLSNDIGESRELSLQRADTASKLSGLLRQALTDANAQLPIDSMYGRPFALPGRILVPTPP